MQHTLGSMIGFAIRATDGEVGKVDEFFFDDATWTIRYLVAETGDWLANRKVLISLVALGKPNWTSGTFPVDLTCDQVRTSPDIDTQMPVHRQHEVELFKYYQWSPYWEGGFGGVLGTTPYPLLEEPLVQETSEEKRSEDPHLRSSREVTGYRIQATDGDIGHLADFIVDDEDWVIRRLIVDTGSWLPGKKVSISPKWIKSVNWADSAVSLDSPRGSVKDSPEFDPSLVP